MFLQVAARVAAAKLEPIAFESIIIDKYWQGTPSISINCLLRVTTPFSASKLAAISGTKTSACLDGNNLYSVP